MKRNKDALPFKTGDYVKFIPVELTEEEKHDLEEKGIKDGQILKIIGFSDDGKLYFTDIMNGIKCSEFEKVNYRYAEFWDRFFAELLDGLIALAIAFPFYVIVDKYFFGASQFINDFGIKDIVLWILFLYNTTYLVGKSGQSWGRKYWNIKVIDYFGRPIGFWRSLFRNFFAITFSTILYLGFISIFWDDKNQAWHDKVFKTYVVFSE